MTTLSVPISGELENFIHKMVKSGEASNKADAVRRALRDWQENKALETILRAEREPTIRGDLKTLLKKMK